MEKVNEKLKALIAIRWVARAITGLFAGLMIFMVTGYALEDGYLIPGGKEAIPFLFAPIGYTLGLIIALKWEGIGGMTIVASVVGWHLAMGITQGNFRLLGPIDLAAIPGLVFLLIWYSFHRQSVSASRQNMGATQTSLSAE